MTAHLEAALAREGRKRSKARAAEAEATAAIRALLQPARDAGITVARIMALTGLSRKGVYDLLRRTPDATVRPPG